MSRARYLLSNINLMNAMLTGVLIFLANYTLPFMNTNMQYSFPVIAKHVEVGPDSGNQADQEKTPSPLDYVLISEQNLFHPDRKIPEEIKEAAPLPKPDFVLYGTLMTADTTIAYMEDKKSPQSSPGRGKRQTPLKLGDSMSGFILKGLDTDRAIMVRGEEKLIVYLNDPAHPKTRTDGPPQIPSVTSEAGGKGMPGEIVRSENRGQSPQKITETPKGMSQPEGTAAPSGSKGAFGGMLQLFRRK